MAKPWGRRNLGYPILGLLCISGPKAPQANGVQHSVQQKCPPGGWGAGSASKVLCKHRTQSTYLGEAEPGVSGLEVDTAQSWPSC